MKNRFFKNIDWTILVCSVILLIIGLVALLSATQNTEYKEFEKQMQWFLISIPIMITVTLIDYEIIVKMSPIFYGIFIILLIGVLFTEKINGASSWFDIGAFSFQPAEFAKVFVVIFLSFIITKLQRRSKREINHFGKLLLTILIVALPVFLIVLQPDYGTAISYIIALICILFISGINKKYIITALLIIIITMPLLYMYVLPEHAKSRIEVFLDPYKDARGAGYNIIQSKLAIGAGQILGMGIFNGNQTQLGYLYPKTTDFIFSVIGEEMGFIVAASIIIIYVILITKAIYIAKTAKDDLGSYIAIGIVGILLFHMAQNIGMTMGLLPITGVPLPFVSYGGSSLVTNFICIGLLLNISARRQKAIFVE